MQLPHNNFVGGPPKYTFPISSPWMSNPTSNFCVRANCALICVTSSGLGIAPSPRKPDSPQHPTATNQQIVQSHKRKVNSVILLIGRGAGHVVPLLRFCALGLEAESCGCPMV